MPHNDLLLIPSPRSLRVASGALELGVGVRYQGPDAAMAERLLAGALAKHSLRFTAQDGAASITVEHDPALAAGAYALHISSQGVRIRVGPGEGIRYALVTLAQLITSHAPALPCLQIEDAPAFPTRGLMLDISRDKVPTLESLFALVDDLERLKFNHLQLYTEHTFAYAGHEDVWRDASPMSADDVRALAAHCVSRGVDLAANQNCLGHLHRWFALPRYAPLAEIQGAETSWTFETDDGRRIEKQGPFSLCPTDPRSLELVRDLLDQTLPLFPSTLANIGFDEAHDLGQGRACEVVKARGRAAVFNDFLRAVCEVTRSHHKRPMFWADMLLKDHGAALLSGDAKFTGALAPIPLIWGYEPDTPFAAHCIALRAAGFECWVCPGTSSWLSIVGRSRVRRANLAAAATCAGQASGFLVTDWGDQGHRQHWPISLLAVAHGAQSAWNPASEFDPRAAGFHLFNDAAIGAFIDELGDIDADLSAHLALRNRSALYAELHRPMSEAPTPATHDDSDQWQQIRNRLATLRGRFEALAPTPCSDLVRAELEHTLRVAEHAADKAIVCRALRLSPGHHPGPPVGGGGTGGTGGTGGGGAALIRLAADMASISEDHRELWLRRNRPGGLDDSAAWYERLVDGYEHPERA